MESARKLGALNVHILRLRKRHHFGSRKYRFITFLWGCSHCDIAITIAKNDFVAHNLAISQVLAFAIAIAVCKIQWSLDNSLKNTPISFYELSKNLKYQCI